jgi:hypothetical protein
VFNPDGTFTLRFEDTGTWNFRKLDGSAARGKIQSIVDRNGNAKQAQGRIFYTKGKSLVFYAYDLADPRGPNLKASFHVWGENDDTSRAVKSLGIFRADNETEGRWILTVDDPHVLAQINTVFVTIETRKKALTLPNGKKILYAFLGNKANHP